MTRNPFSMEGMTKRGRGREAWEICWVSVQTNIDWVWSPWIYVDALMHWIGSSITIGYRRKWSVSYKNGQVVENPWKYIVSFISYPLFEFYEGKWEKKNTRQNINPQNSQAVPEKKHCFIKTDDVTVKTKKLKMKKTITSKHVVVYCNRLEWDIE